MTSAVVHGRPPIELVVELSEHGVRVSVEDDDDGARPVVGPSSPASDRGFGLTIVSQLASRWGSATVGPGRKSVWFALDRAGLPHCRPRGLTCAAPGHPSHGRVRRERGCRRR